MRAYLVIPNAKGILEKPTSPHIGMAYLAATLREAGHEVKVIDMRFDYSMEHVLKKLEEFKPDLVGITGTSPDHKKTYNILKQLKGAGYRVVIGGPHATIYKEKILEETDADYAIIGEGEYSIIELIENLDNPENVKGIIYRKDNNVVFTGNRELIPDLDKIPFPAFDIFELDKYIDKKLPIVTSRGCPYYCTYCSIHITMGRKFRARSAENVVAELEHWHNFGYSYFGFNDDCFTFDMDRAEKICDLILEKNLKIKWELRNGIRIDKVNETLLRKMKDAGCIYIAFGVESANQDVLNKMKKGITVEQVRKAVTLADKVGISRGGFFIIGLPGDNYERFEESLKLALSLPFDEIRFYMAIPYPGTELLDWIKSGNAKQLKTEQEFLNEADSWKPSIIYETKDFTKQEKEKAFNKAFDHVMKYLLRKEMGKIMGTMAWLAWRPKLTRNLVMNTGKKIWSYKRKLERK